jgi:hypothetical protein
MPRVDVDGLEAEAYDYEGAWRGVRAPLCPADIEPRRSLPHAALWRGRPVDAVGGLTIGMPRH